MANLTPIQLDDQTIIYVEASEDMTAPASMPSEETTRTAKGVGDVALRNFQAMQGTIHTYTAYTLNALKIWQRPMWIR